MVKLIRVQTFHLDIFLERYTFILISFINDVMVLIHICEYLLEQSIKNIQFYLQSVLNYFDSTEKSSQTNDLL